MTSLNSLLGIAASGMVAQQFNLDITSNNMANANSTGFKKFRANLEDVLAGKASEGTSSGLPVAGVTASATQMLYSSGALQSTDSNLDLAIIGDGYFQVSLSDGSTAYTRDGAFSLDAEGNLVDSSGNKLIPNLTVDVPAEDIQINPDGTVTVTQDGETTEVGQITLATFPTPEGLDSIGDNLLKETVSSGAPIMSVPGEGNAGTLATNMLEGSTVDLSEEMMNLVTAQRAYQMSSRAAQVADEMMQTANQLAG